MFRFLKFLFWCAAIAAFVWFGMNVPLGNHTLFGHVKRIWQSKETQDLVEGTKKAAQPAAEKVKRAVRDGADDATRTP